MSFAFEREYSLLEEVGIARRASAYELLAGVRVIVWNGT